MASLNEFELISKIKEVLGEQKSPFFELLIGDDAAVRSVDSSSRLVFTADVSVENVHFSSSVMTFEEIGYKSMASNLSDCAAMGALPDGALVQLVFPFAEHEIQNKVIALYKGFEKACRRYNFPLIGGDLSGGTHWVVAITMLGRVAKEKRIVFRNGAHDGDGLWVSGLPGCSAAGFDAIRYFGREKVPEKYELFVNAHISPEPKIDLGQAFSGCDEVHAMMDLSDGVSKDALELGRASGLGVVIDIATLNLPESMLQLSSSLNRPWKKWLLHGGEEYELLFAASEKFRPENYLPEKPIKIGTFTKRFSGLRIFQNGVEEKLDVKSWDHIKRVLH